MSRSKIIGDAIDAALESHFGKPGKKKKELDVSIKGKVKTEPTGRALALGAGVGGGYELGKFALSTISSTLFNQLTKNLGSLGFTIGSFLSFAWDVRSANKEKRRREKEIEEFAAKEARSDHAQRWAKNNLQSITNYRDSTGMFPDLGLSPSVVDAFNQGEIDLALHEYVKSGKGLDLGANPFERPPVKFGWSGRALGLEPTQHDLDVAAGKVEDGYAYIKRKEKEVADEKAQQEEST